MKLEVKEMRKNKRKKHTKAHKKKKLKTLGITPATKEIKIPTKDFFALIREGEEIKILIGKEKEIEKGKLEELKEEKRMEEVPEEKTKREKVKEELELINLKKEFKIKVEETKKKTEEKKKEKKKGFFSRFFRKKKEKEEEKLKRLSLENLERLKKINDREKMIIGVASVLNDFLEIKFRIPRELTHRELVEEIEKRDIKDIALKNELLDFFKRIEVEEYTGHLEEEDPDEVTSLAEKVINELSKFKFIPLSQPK